MPNGFQGSVEEWRRMEAPYARIDPILTAFATQHDLELVKNYRDADRSLRRSDGLNRTIWIASMQKYGESGTYQVAIDAYHDRGSERWLKHGIVGDEVGIDSLALTLERALRILASWSGSDLHLARGRETPERL